MGVAQAPHAGFRQPVDGGRATPVHHSPFVGVGHVVDVRPVRGVRVVRQDGSEVEGDPPVAVDVGVLARHAVASPWVRAPGDAQVARSVPRPDAVAMLVGARRVAARPSLRRRCPPPSPWSPPAATTVEPEPAEPGVPAMRAMPTGVAGVRGDRRGSVEGASPPGSVASLHTDAGDAGKRGKRGGVSSPGSGHATSAGASTPCVFLTWTCLGAGSFQTWAACACAQRGRLVRDVVARRDQEAGPRRVPALAGGRVASPPHVVAAGSQAHVSNGPAVACRHGGGRVAVGRDTVCAHEALVVSQEELDAFAQGIHALVSQNPRPHGQAVVPGMLFFRKIMLRGTQGSQTRARGTLFKKPERRLKGAPLEHGLGVTSKTTRARGNLQANQ